MKLGLPIEENTREVSTQDETRDSGSHLESRFFVHFTVSSQYSRLT